MVRLKGEAVQEGYQAVVDSDKAFALGVDVVAEVCANRRWLRRLLATTRHWKWAHDVVEPRLKVGQDFLLSADDLRKVFKFAGDLVEFDNGFGKCVVHSGIG